MAGSDNEIDFKRMKDGDTPSPQPEPPSIGMSRTNSGSSAGSSPDIDVVGHTPHPMKISPRSVDSASMMSYDDRMREAGGGPLKRYLCQRCLNHGEHWPRKGHKPFCRYVSCPCTLCTMVDERRRLNNAICRQTSVSDEEKGTTAGSQVKVRNPMCARCSAHGIQNRLKNHKKRCPYSDCTCDLCKLVDERRDLMARQIKLRRQQNQRRRMMQATPPSPIVGHPGGPRLPTINYPYSPESMSLQGSMLRAAMTAQGGMAMPLNFASLTDSHQTVVSRQADRQGDRHIESVQTLERNGQLPTNHSMFPYTTDALGEHMRPIMSTATASSTVGRLEGYSAPPQTQTLLVPVQVPITSPIMHQHERGDLCRSQACVSCLEEALRHELKMAELLRVLSNNSGSYAAMFDRMHGIHHTPQTTHFGGVSTSLHGHGLPLVSQESFMATGAAISAAHASQTNKESMLARATAELAHMLHMNNADRGSHN